MTARAAGAALLLLALIAAAAPAPAAADSGATQAAAPTAVRVVIVTMAGLTWEQVAAGQAPTVRALGEAGSMADLSIHTADAPADPASAFATMGAGNRARGRGPGGLALTPLAQPAAGGGLQVLQWEQVQADNDGRHFGALLGSLGQALHDHGLTTGVADTAGPQLSFAALALADRQGRVDAQANPARIPPATVALVPLAGTPQAEDAALAGLAGGLDLSRQSLLVLGLPPGPPQADRLMVAVAAGAGVAPERLLTSATTHRAGLITLPDVAPGVLGLLGLTAPAAMSGQAFHTTAPTANRLGTLLDYQAGALAYRNRQAPFLAVFGLVALAVFLLGWRRLRSPGAAPRWLDRAVVAGGLAVLAAPLAAMVQGRLGAQRWAALPSCALVAGVAGAIVATALAGPWRRHALGPPVFVACLTAVGLSADLVSGAAGQLSSYVGYSPIVAGRFYGMSAPTFATLATCVLILAGLAAGAVARHKVAVAGGIGLIALGLAGAPMFGAKFGAVLTLVPATGLLCLLVAGRRVSLGRTALLAGATAVVALGLGVADALRPASQRTHIGRFVASLAGGGATSPGQVLARKAAANLHIFAEGPASVLVPLAPLALVYMAALLLRPPTWLRAGVARVAGLREGMLAALAANAIGLLVNDSGVAIPAMGIAIGTSLVLVVLLRCRADRLPGG